MTVGMRRKKVDRGAIPPHSTRMWPWQAGVETAVPKLDPDRACALPSGAGNAIVTAPDQNVGFGQTPVESLDCSLCTDAERKTVSMGKLLVVGSVALDTVKTPFGEVTEVSVRDHLFFDRGQLFHVGRPLIAVVGEDFPNSMSRFKAARLI